MTATCVLKVESHVEDFRGERSALRGCGVTWTMDRLRMNVSAADEWWRVVESGW